MSGRAIPLAKPSQEVSTELKELLLTFLAENFFNQVGYNKDHHLALPEFLDGVNKYSVKHELRMPGNSTLTNSFNQMDRDKGGEVGMEEFRHWLREMIVHNENEKWLRLISILSFELLDKDKGGDVTLPELKYELRQFIKNHKQFNTSDIENIPGILNHINPRYYFRIYINDFINFNKFILNALTLNDVVLELISENYFNSLDVHHSGNLTLKDYVFQVKALCIRNGLDLPVFKGLVKEYNTMDEYGMDQVSSKQVNNYLRHHYLASYNSDLRLRVTSPLYNRIDKARRGFIIKEQLREVILEFCRERRIESLSMKELDKYFSWESSHEQFFKLGLISFITQHFTFK